MKNVTNREIMRAIYDRYYKQFSKNNTEYFIEIDLMAICDEKGIDYGVVWGRFFHHLNQVYGYPEKKIEFFGVDNKINFPLLASVLSEEDDKHQRFFLPLAISRISLLISLFSLIVALFFKYS